MAPLSRPDVRVLAQIRDKGGHATDVERQGHGLQRALVIAVLHELADSSALAGEREGDRPPPSLMLAIEEPELYQHPLQARALAGTLSELAADAAAATARSVQVSYSTHSPHFVRPALFESLRLCRRRPGGDMESVAASKEKVREILESAGFRGDLGGRVEHTVATQLAEAVFARAVVLCEGSSDAVTLEAVAERDGGFDREGIAVVAVGSKSLIPICFSILEHVAIPTYVVFDADRAKRGSVLATEVEAMARENRKLLSLCGEEEESWPDDAVRGTCANFHDNLETFFLEHWPELNELLDRASGELRMRGKSGPVYRQAVLQAKAVPEFFTELLAKIRSLH